MIATDLVLGSIAALMAFITAALVRRASEARTRVAAAVVLFLLAMMGGMLAGGLVYAIAPTPATALDGLWVAAASMAGLALPLVAVVLREAEARQRSASTTAAPLVHLGSFVAAAIALVLVDELLMGATFTLVSGSGLGRASSGILGAMTGVVNSPWFLFTMAGEMGITLLLVRARTSAEMLPVLLFQAGLMALAPTTLGSAVWRTIAIYGGSVGMVALIVVVLEFVYRHRSLNPAFSHYLVRLLSVFALQMAGLYLWIADGTTELFALAVVLEMVLYFGAVIRPEPYLTADRRDWQQNARWTFELLLAIFVAELFMGAVLDVQAFGPAFAQALPTAPLAGTWSTVVGNAVANGFWFTATVTNSTWFLAMMGLEMGALVAFKFRETRLRELKVRLALLMASYTFAAVYFPSVYFHAAFPQLPVGASVPVLGWSMGIGSAPLAPAAFLALFLTYAVLGSLTFLFGRRAVCSVFCTAPLMFQGTTIDAMSSFNRTSSIARKYLGSRLSNAYRATSGLVMGSLVGASFLSYFDATGRLSVTIGGADPTVFLFALYFSVLWYILFVTIPYTGNYSCVTMGWCYTGLVSAAFQKLGPYKLKVRSREVCRTCTTLDCARSCPVGLVDMPGHFRTKGEFRSTKCCGVGNCVGACPYGNLYIYDIRHWVRDHWPGISGLPEAARLPVLRPVASTAGAPPGPQRLGPVRSSGLGDLDGRPLRDAHSRL